MTATTVQIAEQIKVLINAADFSEAFDANRDYTAFYSVEDINEMLSVSIVPKEIGIEILSRLPAICKYDYEFHVGIFEHIEVVGAERDARVDELMELVEEVIDFLVKTPVVSEGETHNIAGIENNPAYDYEALASHGVFRTLITAGYEMARGGS